MGKLSQATLCSEIGWRTYRIHHIVVVMAKVYCGNVISFSFSIITGSWRVGLPREGLHSSRLVIRCGLVTEFTLAEWSRRDRVHHWNGNAPPCSLPWSAVWAWSCANPASTMETLSRTQGDRATKQKDSGFLSMCMCSRERWAGAELPSNAGHIPHKVWGGPN